jgi:hypothetical protein
LRATQGAVLWVSTGGRATFASTPPANTFSSNTLYLSPPHPSYPDNYGNCKMNGGAIFGSCG